MRTLKQKLGYLTLLDVHERGFKSSCLQALVLDTAIARLSCDSAFSHFARQGDRHPTTGESSKKLEFLEAS